MVPSKREISGPLAVREKLVLAEKRLAETRRELHQCRESLQRSQAALCAIADGIVVVDIQGHITCMNPVAAHLSGWTEDEALGRPLNDVLHFIDGRGRVHDVITEGFSRDGDDDVVSLVRRDRHSILVDGAVAAVQGREERPLGCIVAFRNVTAAVRLTRELSHHANHDPLTGLPNRRALDARLQRAIDTAADLSCQHSLLYFDLDRFKAVNDSAGHLAGDELLRQLSVMLRGHLRDHDTLARVGGDEFAILLENCGAQQAGLVAEKVRSAIEEFRFEWEGKTFSLGASVGELEFEDDELSVTELINLADRLCYVAKANGRNRVAYRRHHSLGTGTGEDDVSHRHGSRREDVQLPSEPAAPE